MSPKFLLFSIIAVWSCAAAIEALFIQPRSLANFLSMTLTAAKRSPQEYDGYGNYCGWGGEGTPVDSIDRCCQVHDNCYGTVNENECGHYIRNVKLIDYDWHMEGTEIVCDPKDDACGRALCKCDKDIIDCFNENDKDYNPEYNKVIG
uniref:Phospholipase A2 SSD387 n=1 Tax=Scolopendra dehaani TaxID=2609776 RepID=PA21_SCODE|nr:RecName: Full=Phospholipase A2 SSD387; Short=PLA2; Flags: Precursor [Scolopendra dehaani]